MFLKNVIQSLRILLWLEAIVVLIGDDIKFTVTNSKVDLLS